MKKNKGWTKTEKCLPIAIFCKQHNKGDENNNNNNNKQDLFTDVMELLK